MLAFYAFAVKPLLLAHRPPETENAHKEFYLTGYGVDSFEGEVQGIATPVADVTEVAGINTRVEGLLALTPWLRDRKCAS